MSSKTFWRNMAPSSSFETPGTIQPNDTASHHRRFQPSRWYKFTSIAEYSTMKMKAADFSKIMLNFYQTEVSHARKGHSWCEASSSETGSSHGYNLGHLKCQSKKNFSWLWKQKVPPKHWYVSIPAYTVHIPEHSYPQVFSLFILHSEHFSLPSST